MYACLSFICPFDFVWDKLNASPSTKMQPSLVHMSYLRIRMCIRYTAIIKCVDTHPPDIDFPRIPDRIV